jgi:hypothetical protein
MEPNGRPLSENDAIPATAGEWLSARLADFTIVTAFRTGGRRNRVWRLRSHAGDSIFKLHNRRSHWETEVFAYRNWRHVFKPWSAELIASFEAANQGLFGLLLSFINAAVPLREANLNGVAAAAVYRQAGALLRGLHGAGSKPLFGRPGIDGAVQGGGVSAADFNANTARSLRDFAAQGAKLGCFTGDHVRLSLQAADVAERFPLQPAVPTHSDYTPGNWLVDADGKLSAIIDFENMAWSQREDSLVRLVLDYFPDHTEMADAFYDGYGEVVDANHCDRLWVGCVMYAAYHAVSGAESGSESNLAKSARAFRLATR